MHLPRQPHDGRLGFSGLFRVQIHRQAAADPLVAPIDALGRLEHFHVSYGGYGHQTTISSRNLEIGKFTQTLAIGFLKTNANGYFSPFIVEARKSLTSQCIAHNTGHKLRIHVNGFAAVTIDYQRQFVRTPLPSASNSNHPRQCLDHGFQILGYLIEYGSIISLQVDDVDRLAGSLFGFAFSPSP